MEFPIAYCEGISAYLQGRRCSENPYDELEYPSQHYYWNEGYFSEFYAYHGEGFN